LGFIPNPPIMSFFYGVFGGGGGGPSDPMPTNVPSCFVVVLGFNGWIPTAFPLSLLIVN
jgi:hypothetical protein